MPPLIPGAAIIELPHVNPLAEDLVQRRHRHFPPALSETKSFLICLAGECLQRVLARGEPVEKLGDQWTKFRTKSGHSAYRPKLCRARKMSCRSCNCRLRRATDACPTLPKDNFGFGARRLRVLTLSSSIETAFACDAGYQYNPDLKDYFILIIPISSRQERSRGTPDASAIAPFKFR